MKRMQSIKSEHCIYCNVENVMSGKFNGANIKYSCWGQSKTSANIYVNSSTFSTNIYIYIYII